MLENKMDEDQTTETETPEQATVGNPTVEPEPAEDPATASNDAEDPNETFPRAYVEKLRKSEASYRDKAKRADELAHKLHAALVKLDGRLADPEDLEFDPEHLEDGDALSAAISDLVTRKPGLKAQQLAGDVGQGKRGSDPKPEVDLISIMRKLQ